MTTQNNPILGVTQALGYVGEIERITEEVTALLMTDPTTPDEIRQTACNMEAICKRLSSLAITLDRIDPEQAAWARHHARWGMEIVAELEDSLLPGDGFRQYRRTQIAEMRPYVEGEVLSERVSISQTDRENGSPRLGDMIARNPKNHEDMWLVAAAYFADNFEEIA